MSPIDPSQKMKQIKTPKAMTMPAIMLEATPRVGVKASGEVSPMTPYICQSSRMPYRTYPMSPIMEQKVMASSMSMY